LKPAVLPAMKARINYSKEAKANIKGPPAN